MSQRLIIRAEQMQALKDAILRGWLADYLRSIYPQQCSGIGAGEFEEFLGVQIKRARGHGLIADNDIRKYVHVAFLLGSEFERNPDYEWAQSILLEASLSPATRVRALQTATLRHLEDKEANLRAHAAEA
jgi:hypothetical protein